MIWLVTFFLFLLFAVLSFIAGFALRVLTKRWTVDIITICSQGMVCILLLFMVCERICSLLRASIRFAGALWLAVIFVLELLFIFMDSRRFPRFFRLWRQERIRAQAEDSGKRMRLLLKACVLLMMVLQTALVIGFFYDQPAAIVSLKDATLSYDSGRIVAASPMMMFYAWLSLLIRVHPLTMIYTVAPVLLLPMYFGLEWSLAKKLFQKEEKGEEKSLIMMLFFSFLHLFAYQSQAFIGITLLFSFFSGAVFFVHGVLPCLLWFCLEPGKKRQPEENAAQAETNTEEEEWDMKHKIINTRNLAIAFIALAVICAGMGFVLNRKINNLYEAAVNLQNELNESLKVYEFVPEEDGAPRAYLVRRNRGGFIVLGGGSEKEGELLYDFLTEHGCDAVTAWYLNGEDPEEAGAYEICAERGLPVDTVYNTGIEEYRPK